MKTQENWYVYRHIRLDKNEPFYIGIGCQKNFGRAFQKGNRRSVFWNQIASKTKYEVEIIFENVSKKFACNKEKEFISLYGRKDLKNGTLVNLTIGGDAPPIQFGEKNPMKKQENKDKISLFMKNRVVSSETKLKQSISKKNNKITPPSQKGVKRNQISIDKQRLKIKGSKSVKAKKVIDKESGNIWGCVKDCAFEKGIKYSTLVNMLNGFRKNNTQLTYL